MQVTTTSRATPKTTRRAARISQIPGLQLVSYPDRDLEAPVLLVGRECLALAWGSRRYRWHPGLLHTRLEAGFSHPLVRAMDLRPGDRVLDSSLGLGTDAHFLARLTGERVVALEAVPALALLSAEGLSGAGAAVQVICAEGAAFLRTLPSDSFDVVQGDPMFPPGTGLNHSLDVVRAVARHTPLGMTWLAQARRVARKRVVIRDVDPGELLEVMGCPEVLRVGRGRPRYGVWRSA